MSIIKMAYALHHFPDYQGDRHPWHWFSGRTIDDLVRSSAHISEAAALEYMGKRLLQMAQQQREPAAQSRG